MAHDIYPAAVSIA